MESWTQGMEGSEKQHTCEKGRSEGVQNLLLEAFHIHELALRSLWHLFSVLERFSFKCRKTKTEVITLTNHKRHRQSNEPIRTQSKYM